MNLIDRYLSAVAQNLPESRRDDITRELRANILDRLENIAEEQNRKTTAADESYVLHQLGHPQQVAASFLPAQMLVSQEWFPFYKQCLSYGMILIFIVQLVIFGIQFLISGTLHIPGLISGVLHAGLLMFAIMTGVFYALSNSGYPKGLSPYCNWSPEKLPPVKHRWQRIKTLDSACDFANAIFFLLILQYSLWLPASTLATLVIGFSVEIEALLIPLTLWTLATLAFNLWNLRFGYWTPAKLLMAIVLNLVGSIFALMIFFMPQALIATSELPPAISIDMVNRILDLVMVITACGLLIVVARNAYRFWLLKVKS